MKASHPPLRQPQTGPRYQGISHQNARTATSVTPKTMPADFSPSRFQVPAVPFGLEKASKKRARSVALTMRMPPSAKAKSGGVCTLRYWHGGWPTRAPAHQWSVG